MGRHGVQIGVMPLTAQWEKGPLGEAGRLNLLDGGDMRLAIALSEANGSR